MQQLLQYPDAARRRRNAMTHAVVPAAWRGPSARRGMIVGWR
ncbi:hypothetical protein [Curtobacterium sp. MCBD17_032]|nr:hypothetical protein [Curtobacterium sp. MCBD17_032]